MITADLDLARRTAEQHAERLPQEGVNGAPSLETIRAVGTLAHLALFEWEGLHQYVKDGAEGEWAREHVSMALTMLERSKTNVSKSIRILEHLNQTAFPFTVEQLRDLEVRLENAYAEGKQLSTLMARRFPSLPQSALNRIEAIGGPEDKTEYLDEKTFLRRLGVDR